MKTILFLAIFCITYSGILAGTTDPNVHDQHYLNYGEKFKCVVSLCGTENDDQLYCASGVVIKPNWVLTAAHVIKKAKTGNIFINNNKIKVSTFIPHSKFESDIFGYYDIGLVYCENNIELDFYPELYKDEDEMGKICSLSGYGIKGTFITGSRVGDNKKRAGSNRIMGIERHMLTCDLKDSNTPMEFLISSGDSGGGLFIDKKLAGIHSCVIATDGNTNSNYSDESGHTRISQHLEWIESTINENKKK